MSTNKEYSIPRHKLSLEEKKKSDEILIKERFRQLREMDESSKIYSELLNIKYEIADYLELDFYDADNSFAKYLKKYINVFDLKRKEMAKNLSIHETKFSRIINDKENPGLNVLYRIEEHSNGILKAEMLWRLVGKKIEFEIMGNKKDRRIQSQKVKNRFRFKKKTATNKGSKQ